MDATGSDALAAMWRADEERGVDPRRIEATGSPPPPLQRPRVPAPDWRAEAAERERQEQRERRRRERPSAEEIASEELSAKAPPPVRVPVVSTGWDARQLRPGGRP